MWITLVPIFPAKRKNYIQQKNFKHRKHKRNRKGKIAEKAE
jgi:hypothetical protein